MSQSELLVPEYDHEIAVTREVLERVPDDRGEWKPHLNAFAMAHLAQLLARLPGWVPLMFDRDELDIMPTTGPNPPPDVPPRRPQRCSRSSTALPQQDMPRFLPPRTFSFRARTIDHDCERRS